MILKLYRTVLILIFVLISNYQWSQEGDYSLRDHWLSNKFKDPNSSVYNTQQFQNASVHNLVKGKKYYFSRKYKSAIKYFKEFLKEDTPLNDYALYYLGSCYFKLNQYKTATIYYKKLQTNYPFSRFHVDALENLAESYLKLGHWSKLIHQFETEMIMEEDNDLLSLYYFYLGKTYAAMKKEKKALKYFLKTAKYQDDWSLKSIDEIEKLSDNLVQYNKSEYVYFAQSLVEEEEYSQAIEILNRVKTVADKQAKYLHSYLLGLSYFNKDEITKARHWFKSAEENAIKSADKFNAGYYYFNTFFDSNKDKAIEGIAKLLMFTSAENTGSALKKLVSYYYEKRDWNQFSRYLKSLGKKNQSKIIWKYLFKTLNKNKLHEIVRYFPAAVAQLKNEKMKSKCYYWIGVAALKSYNYNLAEKYLKESYLAYKHNYYSYKSLLYIQNYNIKKKFRLSFNQLREIEREKVNSFLTSFEFKNKVRTTYYPLFGSKLHPGLKRALYCYHADYKAYGNKELEYFLAHIETPEKYYRGLAYYFKNIKEYQLSIRYAYRLVDYLNGPEGHNYIPEDLISYCYPKRFEHIVNSASKQYGVSQFLVYAVIREESRFNPKARSWAGARGLMQIMPRTGRYLARKTNMKKINLYDVKTNINLGAYYLSHLIKKFDSYSYALASYNGGPGRMNTRLKEAIKEGDHILTGEHLIELISNNETRNYVKKVLKSYYCYLDLYDQID